MSILKLIFIYGVVVTIFNVIWFFIEWLIKLVLTNQIGTNQIVKTISIGILSVLLAHESNLFVSNNSIEGNYEWVIKLIGALILYIYVVGKAEKRKLNVFAGLNQINANSQSSYPKWLPYLGVGLYIAGIFLTQISNNPLTNWFHNHIFDIYNTFFLKLIFGFIAFFFMLDIISRAFNAFSGSGEKQNPNQEVQREKSDDDFDDYEIVDDNKINE